MFDIRENLKNLPTSPGVYLHKDGMGEVIYVGKARNLSNRVRQYFQASKSDNPKLKALRKSIYEFEYIVCGSEAEALILENNLIKKYMPRYNVLLRDDKTYPYIKITNDSFPRVEKTRLIKKDGAEYFGPFSDAGAVNEMIELLSNTFKLKRCKRNNFPKNFRPCLHYFIGNCEAMCKFDVSKSAYKEKIKKVEGFLKGNDRSLEAFLEAEMKKAASQLKFEAAASYRDSLACARAIHEKQRVEISKSKSMDIVLWAGENNIAIFFVRDGKLCGREIFELSNYTEYDEKNAAMGEFLKQHYQKQTTGPSEIALADKVDDMSLIGEVLSELWGHKTEVTLPKRGQRKAVVDMAEKDAVLLHEGESRRRETRRDREERLHSELERIIVSAGGIRKKQPYRVEAYDISNNNGLYTVGAMVVFEDMKYQRNAYRKFKVKTTDGPDDYQSMKEVVFRRSSRALSGDEAFLPLPDLIVLDGGKGHLSSVAQVQEALNLNIPMIGLTKDDRHRTKTMVWKEGENTVEEELAGRGLLFSYFGKIQEEVHRFAINYHRTLRKNKSMHSVLDEIPGIGEKRKNALLREFGSIKAVKEATFSQLEAVDGMNGKAAEEVKKFFDLQNSDN